MLSWNLKLFFSMRNKVRKIHGAIEEGIKIDTVLEINGIVKFERSQWYSIKNKTALSSNLKSLIIMIQEFCYFFA